MKNKVLALIDPVGGKAGMDYYDIFLLESIAAKGYKTILFSNFDQKSAAVQVVRSFNNIGINKVLAIFNNFYQFIKALVFCKRNAVDWLILHFFRGGLFDLVTIGLARIIGIRILLIVHDVKTLDALVLPFTRKIILTHFNFAKIVHNKFSYHQLEAFIGEKSMGNVHIIPHGNYVSLFEGVPGRADWPDEAFSITGKRCLLFFGQLKKAKGLDILVESFIQAGTGFHLVMAGKSRDDDFSEYRKMLINAGLEGHFTIINRFVTDEERDFLFRNCEIVIVPYKWVYQSGVLIMAMSYSKTVVASAIDPFVEIIKHEENGLLFEPENIDSLSFIIKKLYRNEYDREKMEKQAFQTALKSHNWLNIGNFYAKILET